ncbi:MAG TPA: hypothetical protein VF375_03950 [Candidatus Limnocylindrales bacterium]
MDVSQQAATISALEAATDVLIVALSRRPDPDLEAATAALKAREMAIRLLVGSDPKKRPPDMNARLRRILDTDRAVADHLRTEMDSLRERLADTRQLMHAASTGGGARSGAAHSGRNR